MKKFVVVPLVAGVTAATVTGSSTGSLYSEYQFAETEAIVALVRDAARLVAVNGESAWSVFKQPGSKWRSGDTYIFVLDTAGNMVCHPDPALEGRNQLELKDVNGKPIIHGILKQGSFRKNTGEGWFHYQWPEPESIFPAWKTTCSILVTAPSGKNYVVAGGKYNMKMEKAFVMDRVQAAVDLIERRGPAAFQRLRDPADEFLFKDAYVFVIGFDGKDLVNPGFPSLEGRDLLRLRDARGTQLVKEMIETVKSSGSGWVSYLWPKPGGQVMAEKTSYVAKAKCGEQEVVVGCGVYLEEAPLEPVAQPMTPAQLMSLVRNAAAELEKKGETALPEFRVEGSKWRYGDIYLFVWDISGTSIFHGANPEQEGAELRDLRDVHGKPVGQMFIDTVSTGPREGWVHYFWPKPGSLFPGWKSTFLKRVSFPSGRDCFVGCGLYDMKVDKTFVTQTVDAACALLEREGKAAFPKIRSKAGPFVFLDTYVFVMSKDGVELVNYAFPSLEGRSLMGCRDARGRFIVREEIDMAMRHGSGWVEVSWPKPGETNPSNRQNYLRKVDHNGETFIVGSGVYLD